MGAPQSKLYLSFIVEVSFIGSRVNLSTLSEK
jgi:hypothetical protein